MWKNKFQFNKRLIRSMKFNTKNLLWIFSLKEKLNLRKLYKDERVMRINILLASTPYNVLKTKTKYDIKIEILVELLLWYENYVLI